jgi:hypothetical protein
MCIMAARVKPSFADQLHARARVDAKYARWEGVVEVFGLDRHSKANQAYGWQFWEGRNAQYTVVLGIPPVDSPNAAVGASIAAEREKMQDNSQ